MVSEWGAQAPWKWKGDDKWAVGWQVEQLWDGPGEHPGNSPPGANIQTHVTFLLLRRLRRWLWWQMHSDTKGLLELTGIKKWEEIYRMMVYNTKVRKTNVYNKCEHVDLQDEGLHQDSYITATELFNLKVQICSWWRQSFRLSSKTPFIFF